MNTNLFDYFEDLPRNGGAGAHWRRARHCVPVAALM